MSKQTYRNTAEDLRQFITEEAFDAFYDRIRNARNDEEIGDMTKKSHGTLNLPADQIRDQAAFFIKSSETTPPIEGYVVVPIPDSKDNNDVGLTGYIPTEIGVTVIE
jgi:hypothetical protein